LFHFQRAPVALKTQSPDWGNRDPEVCETATRPLAGGAIRGSSGYGFRFATIVGLVAALQPGM
jgi:hypothetical protein